MKVFDYMRKYGHEEVVLCHDEASGLRAIIALHDSTLGPPNGGTRRWVYKSEDEAIEDALRLARSQSYKQAAAGLNGGGGKGVIMVDSMEQNSEELYRAYGKFVESLGGRFITGEDVGTGDLELRYISMETNYVVGLPEMRVGVPADYGNIMPTALGTLCGMKACAKKAYGSDSLKGKVIALQGLGKVGYLMVNLLRKEEAKLIVTDIEDELVKRVLGKDVTPVAPKEIYGVNCDIFCPCAMGAILNDDTIPQLKCQIVAGSANNQLKEDKHGDELHRRKIVYAPDVIINAGGAIDFLDAMTYGGEYSYRRSRASVEHIYDRIYGILERSERENIPTYKIATMIAEERINKYKAIHDLRPERSKAIRAGFGKT